MNQPLAIAPRSGHLTMATRRSSANSAGAIKAVALGAAVLAATILYIWKQVEWDRVELQISDAEKRIQLLEEKADRLGAEIARSKKPGTIQQVAQQRLGMEYPSGAAQTDLYVRAGAGE